LCPARYCCCHKQQASQQFWGSRGGSSVWQFWCVLAELVPCPVLLLPKAAA
jgi:hypothetical protein